MRLAHTAVLAVLLAPAIAEAQQPPAPAAPDTRPEAATPASSSRTFTAPIGLIFNTVRPERVADFEKLIGYLEAALASSTDATVQRQARGWRVLKATEPGPNGSVLYVFLLDPAEAGADYGLGRVLAQAYPDQAQLQEIWKLYTDSVSSGGTLLNLTPVQPPPPSAAPQP